MDPSAAFASKDHKIVFWCRLIRSSADTLVFAFLAEESSTDAQSAEPSLIGQCKFEDKNLHIIAIDLEVTFKMHYFSHFKFHY